MKKFDVIIFDLDCTLVSIEGLPWLSQEVLQKELPLLSASLDGTGSLQIAFQKELSMLSPSYTDMLSLGRKYKDSLVEDAKSVVDSLHLLGKEVWLMTNNFHPAIDIIGNTLGIPLHRVIGSDMVFDHTGKYQGYDQESPLVRNGGKAEVIKRFILPDLKVACIGDAVPDLETKPVVDLFIGYGGVVSREVVKNQAHIFVTSKNLSSLLPILLEKDEIETLKEHQSI